MSASQAAIAQVLELAKEDYYGLWEAQWALTSLDPTVSEATRIQMAREAIRELWQRGLIELYRASSDLTPLGRIPRAGIERALSDERYWHPPHGSHAEVVAFTATDVGDEFENPRSSDN